MVGKQSKAPAPRGQGKAARLEAEWLAKQAALYDKWKQLAEDVTDIPLTPRRQDVQVMRFGLAWVPVWQVPPVAADEQQPVLHGVLTSHPEPQVCVARLHA